ncbi:MAG: ribosome-associated translation inhibitor RaiA [Deltaproteobacteria bacterium]|nr:ribosome-associated translation inhibitor RaiA [Deltaproteobacteria bacterium]
MATPVQLTYRDFPSSPAVTEHVERRAAKLETYSDRLMTCHVVVEQPHRHSRHGQKFHVRIDMHVPGRELVVSKTSASSTLDLHATIDEAFGEAERVLEDHVRERRDRVRRPHAMR